MDNDKLVKAAGKAAWWLTKGSTRAVANLATVAWFGVAVLCSLIPVAGWAITIVMVVSYFAGRAVIRGFFPRR